MNKAFVLALVAAATILASGLTTTSYAASAHNSQAGSNGPSNVNAPTKNATDPQG